MAKTEYCVRFVYDEDAQFEECNGENRPLSEEEYAENAYMKDGKPVSYADYLDYYGNPDRHVYLGVVVDKKCRCCGNWDKSVSSVWNVDMMDDDPGLSHITIGDALSPDEALALPGYLAEVAKEELIDAGWRQPKTAKKGR